ncbi:MAG: DUF3299 domain-containing protein [Bacteroidia bacterium]|nr:DUF3299 domain-containing protein [Bacteroidia bacterium]
MRYWILVSLLSLISCADPAAHNGAVTDTDQMIQSDDRQLVLPKQQEDPLPPADQVLSGAVPVGASRLTWEDLKDVVFEEKFYDELDQLLLFPVFGEKIKARAGSTVMISGYVIPVDPGDENTPGRYVLSANPFSACFFCGNAGPESVVELELADPDQMFANDEFRSFTGKLQLNDEDVDKLNYLLVDASVR